MTSQDLIFDNTWQKLSMFIWLCHQKFKDQS